MGYFTELWNSVFNEGITSAQETTITVTFASLVIINFLLLYVTKSIHFVFIQILTLGLWWGMKWFLAEYKEVLKNEQKQAGKSLNNKQSDESIKESGPAVSETEDVKQTVKATSKIAETKVSATVENKQNVNVISTKSEPKETTESKPRKRTGKSKKRKV
ncbi:hypothetical protein DASB73_020850 [Starmerella bacillaris]|uniref:V-type ATPase assembly factor PKR1 n=1 Tax=Starmerella bacillaris TaxID=1247836 RepID=A0AAV5RJD2_STABA|nr:hypothetical protein DASB73_020850 [Starmerella bacillaris]